MKLRVPYVIGASALSLSLAATGCSDSSSPAPAESAPVSLVSMESVVPGAECATGGVKLHSGIDTNRNGKLDASEATSSQLICNGTNTIMRSTPLPQDDSHCTNGGTRIDIGVDDGAGGGIAGDGKLQDGEVDSTTYACDGWTVKPIDPPAGPVGTHSIDTRGGNGTEGAGGNGGNIEFFLGGSSSSVAGHMKVFKTGSLQVTCDVPQVQFDLGANPLVVGPSDTLTVTFVQDETGLTDGQLYMLPTDNGALFRRTGDDRVQITGLHVKQGAKLVLPMNTADGTDLRLPKSIVVEGTLESALVEVSGRRASLNLTSSLIVTGPQGLIDTRGKDGDESTPGGHGGNVSLSAQNVSGQFESNDIGRIILHGSISTSGGRGRAGGSAGRVDVIASVGLTKTGDFVMRGGEGLVDSGGYGGNSNMDTDYGQICNAGLVDTSGGKGKMSGGSAGSFEISPSRASVRNAGSFVAKGGDVDASCAVGECQAGNGGSVNLYAPGTTMMIAGSFVLDGGASPSGHGGNGGYFGVESYQGDGYNGGTAMPPADAYVSAPVSVRGGNGRIGGHGGDAYGYLDVDEGAMAQEFFMLGYVEWITSGGNGTTDGGRGGEIDLYSEQSENNNGYPYSNGPGGGVVNYANLTTKGGHGGTGNGGSGGDVEIFTEDEYSGMTTAEVVHNYGNITTDSGNGTTADQPGRIWIFGGNGVNNHGRISAVAGSTSMADTNGAYGGWVELVSDVGDVSNTGEIVSRGGKATAAASVGGSGGYVRLTGRNVTNSGKLVSQGETGGREGGRGGLIAVRALDGVATNTATDLNVAGGGGDAPGALGAIWVDGFDVTKQFHP